MTHDKQLEMANAIYSHYYGHLDDKYFFAEKSQEIYEWLVNGDPTDNLDEAIEEWGEYDADEIKRQRQKLPAAVELGRRGGRSTSDAKRASSAANGKRGGRPRKS